VTAHLRYIPNAPWIASRYPASFSQRVECGRCPRIDLAVQRSEAACDQREPGHGGRQLGRASRSRGRQQQRAAAQERGVRTSQTRRIADRSAQAWARLGSEQMRTGNSMARCSLHTASWSRLGRWQGAVCTSSWSRLGRVGTERPAASSSTFRCSASSSSWRSGRLYQRHTQSLGNDRASVTLGIPVLEPEIHL
jgi:hypothetical protein